MEDMPVLNGEDKYPKSLSAGDRRRGVNVSNNKNYTN
jgi:hypothetical protein